MHSPTLNKALLWQQHVNILRKATDRLKQVQIECRDFVYIIKHYDRPEVIFYVDPPYLGVKGADTEYYKGAPAMTIARHKEMASLLNNIQGKAIVSYYPHLLLEGLYPKPKWMWLEKKMPKPSDGVSGDAKSKGIELLICNFEPAPLLRWGEANRG